MTQSPTARRTLAAFGALLVLAFATAAIMREPPPPAAQPEAPPAEPMPPDTLRLPVPIDRGSTLGGLLAAHDLPARSIRQAALEHYDLARIRPDRELFLEYRADAEQPVAVRYQVDADHTVVVERDGPAWAARMEAVAYDSEVGTRSFELTRSLWQDGLDAGLRPRDLVRLARIFEYELDFNSELREGARFSLVADIETAPGRKARLGTIHAIRLVNEGEAITAVRHVLADDTEAWFHPDGTGMKRPFLRSPLEFSRVTSGFDRNRYHPILKRRRPHNGTDFGAPTGTPVRAVADGVVTHAARNGGHGRFVKLDHSGPYHTSYSHLSRITVRRGARVKQGDIIGHVGATGLATGPHLHWQMWKHGRYVDPMEVELPNSEPLPPSERAAFQRAVETWTPHL